MANQGMKGIQIHDCIYHHTVRHRLKHKHKRKTWIYCTCALILITPISNTQTNRHIYSLIAHFSHLTNIIYYHFIIYIITIQLQHDENYRKRKTNKLKTKRNTPKPDRESKKKTKQKKEQQKTSKQTSRTNNTTNTTTTKHYN